VSEVNQEEEQELPPIPRYSWATLEPELSAFKSVIDPFIGATVAGSVLRNLVDGLQSCFVRPVAHGILEDSLNHLVGARLTEDAAKNLAYRFVVQKANVLQGTPLVSASPERANFWAASQIVRAEAKYKDRELGVLLTFRLVSTLAAPDEITQWWRHKKAAYLANYRDEKNRGFGFRWLRMSRRNEDPSGYPYDDARQFFGLWCFVFIEGRRDNKWVFRSIGHTDVTMKHNRELLKKRDRMYTACEQDEAFDKDCWFCPIGLDVCPNATHSVSYFADYCERCGRDDNFEPGQPAICMHCQVGGG
jgi:hypothetical protein